MSNEQLSLFPEESAKEQAEFDADAFAERVAKAASRPEHQDSIDRREYDKTARDGWVTGTIGERAVASQVETPAEKADEDYGNQGRSRAAQQRMKRADGAAARASYYRNR